MKEYTIKEANKRVIRTFDRETWFSNEEDAIAWAEQETDESMPECGNVIGVVTESGEYFIVDAETNKIETVVVE